MSPAMRLATVTLFVAASSIAVAASPERGRQLFVKHGCWQCHNYDGQGAVTGTKIAPNPMPLEAMSAFVRNSNAAMPPYPKAILPDEDLADIHAYLQSIPKAPDPKTIPLLSP